jgi:hypothetical protein
MGNSPRTQHSRRPVLLIQTRSVGDKEAETDLFSSQTSEQVISVLFVKTL